MGLQKSRSSKRKLESNHLLESQKDKKGIDPRSHSKLLCKRFKMGGKREQKPEEQDVVRIVSRVGLEVCGGLETHVSSGIPKMRQEKPKSVLASLPLLRATVNEKESKRRKEKRVKRCKIS